jgi:hypothetical protein
MIWRFRVSVFRVVPVVIGLILFGSTVQGQAVPPDYAGKTRTYYVAADEVNWDYAPSDRDEAMGMPFDELQKGYTESGPHRIGRVYKKAMYREYYRRAVVIDAGPKNTTKEDTFRSERRSTLQKPLTEPTLLEMSGYPTNRELT